ncbi:MAG: hypothetical protein WD042_18710 [Phycisphaeraceae bacterium]
MSAQPDAPTTDAIGANEQLPGGAVMRLGSPALRFPEHVRSLVFMPDGQSIAVGMELGAVQIVDVKTCKLLQTIATGLFDVQAMAISSDGTKIVVMGHDIMPVEL